MPNPFFFGHAGTNKGRAAGRDLFRERVEAFGAVALLFEGPALVLHDVGDLQLLAEVFEHLWHAFVCQTCDNNAQRFRGGLAFKARRLLYHSSLDLRVITQKKNYKRARHVGDAGTPTTYPPFRATHRCGNRSMRPSLRNRMETRLLSYLSVVVTTGVPRS